MRHATPCETVGLNQGTGQVLAVADDGLTARVRSNTVAGGTADAMLVQPSTFNPQPSTLNHKPSTLNHQPSTLNPQPSTLNPQGATLNPQFASTLNPQFAG